MYYPSEWRPLLQQFLRHEGGYVRTGTMETLFGLIDRTWVEHLPNVSLEEINEQPEPSRSMLRGIRRAPEGQRLGLVREWMQFVGRETHAMDGRPQPDFGIPRQSKEGAEDRGNRTLVAATHELSSGIIYRGYIRDAGFGALNVDHQTLSSIIDAGARHGVYFTWAMLAKAGETAGLYDQTTTNRLGWLDSSTLPLGSSYRHGEGGYNYTRRAGQREVIEAINAGLTAENQSVFFDEVGYWRRVFVTNPRDGEAIKQWDLERIAHFHGSPSEYQARKAERLLQPVSDARITQASVNVEIGEATPTETALVQSFYRGLFDEGVWPSLATYARREVVIELPDQMGRFHYSVAYAMGEIKSADLTSVERRMLPMLDTIIEAPEPSRVEILRTGEKSALDDYQNPYADTVVLRWRDPQTNEVQSMVVNPGMSEQALALEYNDSWRGRDVYFDPENPARLDANRSGHLSIVTNDPEQRQFWVTPVGNSFEIQSVALPTDAPATPAILAQQSTTGPRR